MRAFNSQIAAARRTDTDTAEYLRGPQALLDSSSPLQWWRTREPMTFHPRELRPLRMALMATCLAAEPDWRRAILGNTPIAIGIAVRQMKFHPITAPEVDLSVSAVLACAIEGNATSAILLSSALRRRAKIDPACRPLSDLWLVATF